MKTPINQCSQGYLYVATGEKYVREAALSANSLKTVDPNANITLVTDCSTDKMPFDRVEIEALAGRKSWNEEAEAGEQAYGKNWESALQYKVKHMYAPSPYEKTLFLDTDTYIYGSCHELFELLDYFDICISIAPGERAFPHIDGKPLRAYIPYNTGVVAYRKSEKVQQFFEAWDRIYESKFTNTDRLRKGESDQTAFMEAWLEVDVKIYVIPHSMWNARLPFFMLLNDSVRIVHGRHNDYEKLRTKINAFRGHRCWNPQQEKCMYRRKNLKYYAERMSSLWKDFCESPVSERLTSKVFKKDRTLTEV
ncbi:MAG: hypothetical protein J7641_15870 [Cyanobacteria bacterium SID2]|nr:hypothetical protein [Cyanobacteria bacterium SID2]MBP0006063.1 hypothetical protein [Cyanobacteria bacterium SBC]